MNKTATIRPLLSLLLKVYNQSVQFYYHFPDVIICGTHRLEREELEVLLSGGYLSSYHTDSFGKLYRLSKKGDEMLQQELFRRRSRKHSTFTTVQNCLPF